MGNFDVLKDISARTGGDVYLGVVGPVRTGKSTFIKRFMEKLVLPNISDIHERERAVDELPQSASGRTVMTAEPKFIPADAVEITVGDGLRMRVRLVDCVGYGVEGAEGFYDGAEPRMVDTPWFAEPVSFQQAAETGTQKVIQEHSSVGIVIISDGSFGDIPFESYLPAATRVVEELKESGKPFVVVLNSANPESTETTAIAQDLQDRWGVIVVPLDVSRLDLDDIVDVLNAALYEFPVSEININLPRWVQELEPTHWLRSGYEQHIGDAVSRVSRVRDVSLLLDELQQDDNADQVRLLDLDLGSGAATVQVQPADGLFYRVLSEYAGQDVSSEQGLMSLVRRTSNAARRWERLEPAMDEVNEEGYGVVQPQLEEMFLEEPELIKQGGHFGVRLRASAPSYHIIRTNVSTEITPLIGTERQCQELVRYIMDEFQDDPAKIWQTNIFGKSLHELASDGIGNKLDQVPEQVRHKLADTLQRVVSDSGGGVICIIL